MVIRQFILSLLCLFAINTTLWAQIPNLPNNVDAISNTKLEEYVKEAESKGLSDSEIENLAKAQGYSAEDIAKIKERVSGLKTNTNSNTQDSNTKREQLEILSERIELTEDKPIKSALYGKSLFENKKLLFEPNLKLATPRNYILGTNDEISIDISGYAYQHYSCTVSPEGTIKIESLAPIFVSGLTINDAKVKIIERLKVLFGGLRTGKLSVDVTLGNLRSINVSLVGEVTNPGSYTLSSVATLFNALYTAGGPTDKGSFRKIDLLRGNKLIKSFDLYEFINEGKIDNNTLLNDQDIIFIPVAETHVQLKGEVKTPATFELKANENLTSLLTFAGGFNDIAYKKSLNIIRYTDIEKKLITINETAFENARLINGDIVEVGAVIDRFENQVEILGAVKRPGKYALGSNNKDLKDIIELAGGLRDDAYLERVLISRKNEILDEETVSINLKTTYIPVPLKNEDRILIKSLVELREKPVINIIGAVNNPGEYDFSQKLSVSDLIILAGGFKEGANREKIEIARRINDGNEVLKNNTELIYTNYNVSNNESLLLNPFDEVYVRFIPYYGTQKRVMIAGLVKYPGTYVIQNNNEKITNLIERAGGLLENAYIKGSKFYRDGKIVGLDLRKIIQKPTDFNNLILMEGDRLIIPQEEEIVNLTGEFLNPSQIIYNPSFRFKDYIAQAGGFTDSAFVRKTYVNYANGRTDRTRSFLGIKKYPKIEKGMTIVVPLKKAKNVTTRELFTLLSSLTSLALILLTILRIK